jgi:hypothetical protein
VAKSGIKLDYYTTGNRKLIMIVAIVIRVCVKVGRTEIKKQRKLSMKVAIVANLRSRKSRPYGNCHILTGILGIFKSITALKSP